MGVHQHIYLGPYLQLKSRSIESELTSFGCNNEACLGINERGVDPASPHASLHKFCSICGKAYGLRRSKVARQISMDDVVRDKLASVGTEDRDGGIVFLAPNMAPSMTPRPFRWDRSDEEHVDIRTIDQDAEMEWLRKHYVIEIEQLKNVFGDVKVSWGLHLYFI
jgi:hypothetical protein